LGSLSPVLTPIPNVINYLIEEPSIYVKDNSPPFATSLLNKRTLIGSWVK
jgi:hypothetical protein